MTPFSLASSAMSGSCWGTTRDIVLPTSSRKPLGTRSAAPMTVANTATARMTTMTPMTNCQAQNGTYVARFIGHSMRTGMALCISAKIQNVKDPLRVVCIGGGLGAPTVMAGLRTFTADITGIIGVTDSGRPKGTVRNAPDVPAPGALRTAHPGPAEGGPVLPRLVQRRLDPA